MKKRILAAVVAAASVLSLAGCGEKSNNSGTTSNGGNSAPAASNTGDSSTPAPANSGDTSGDTSTPEAKEPQLVDTGYKLGDDEDKTLTIGVWNEEWKGFFEKYYKVPDGVTVKWVSNTNEGGVYQTKMDGYLANSGKDDDGQQIDLFLAEADYIKKYVLSDYTTDLKGLGIETGQMYEYVVNAGTDGSGKLKAASFQACPNVLIYRRSIARDVLGTDDPAEVQSKLDSWDKFSEVAASAKEKGYYMTPSALETYRVFANNAEKAFLDSSDNFQVPDTFNTWLAQAETFMEKGYTLGDGIWGDEKAAQKGKNGKTMCFFGPAWYYNFCMKESHEEAMGDWAVCKGPMEAFWGGTWMLIPETADSKGLAADVIKAFTVNEDLLTQLIEIDTQYANKKDLMKKYADSTTYGNEFLGGQNDIAIMYEVAEGIKWNNDLHTIYDQTFNEKLPEQMLEYLNGASTKDDAWTNFYTFLQTVAPSVKVPE